jgi:hypothetical protein
METSEHQRLKQLAVAFLREHGCLAVATEVRCPISRYRVDVAGYADVVVSRSSPLIGERHGNGARRPHRCPPRTVFIECKCSRADFLRDRQDRERLLRRRLQLDRLRGAMEEQRLRIEEPDLRCAGSSLFPEMETWEFTRSRLPAYRRLLRRLRRLDQMLHGQTKFCMMSRYALADRLYIAAPHGMLKPRELPPGWGLLESSKRALKGRDPNGDLFGDSLLEVRVTAPPLPTKQLYHERLLRNIAVSASAAASSAMGVLA